MISRIPSKKDGKNNVPNPVADNLPRGVADIADVAITVNGSDHGTASVRAVAGGAASFWRQHPYKGEFDDINLMLPVEDLGEGTHTVRVTTSENTAGLTGFAEFAFTLAKETTGGGGGGSTSMTVNIHLPVEPKPKVADQLQYYFGVRDPLEDDPWFAERPKQPASLVFHGELDGLPAQIRILGRPPRLTPNIDSFNARAPVVVNDEIRLFTGQFTETGPETNLFRYTITIPAPPPRERWIVKEVRAPRNSAIGSYFPNTLRVKGLPSTEGFALKIHDIRADLKEHDGWMYPKGGEDSVAIGHIFAKPDGADQFLIYAQGNLHIFASPNPGGKVDGDLLITSGSAMSPPNNAPASFATGNRNTDATVAKTDETVYRLTLTEIDSEWWPEPDKKATITATFEPADLKAKIIFILSDVSYYPGFCSNAGSGTGPDLQIMAADNPDLEVPTDPALAAKTKQPENSATIAIHCSDYGAHGKLTAVGLTQKSPIPAINRNLQANHSPIPWDEDDDGMADSWELKFVGNIGDLTASCDKDFAFTTSTSGQNRHTTTGDGITAFDEYRGFMVIDYTTGKESHVRTSPICKDLFIDNDLLRRPNPSYSGFDEIPVDKKIFRNLGYEYHYVKTYDLFNRFLCRNGHSPQKVITIEGDYESGPSTTVGENFGNPVPGTPMTSGRIVIYFKSLDSVMGGAPYNATRRQNVLHHEIGHSCYLVYDNALTRHCTSRSSCVMTLESKDRKSGYLEEFCDSCRSKTKIK